MKIKHSSLFSSQFSLHNSVCERQGREKLMVFGSLQQRMKKLEAKESGNEKKGYIILFQLFLTMSAEKPCTNEFTVYV